MKRILLLLLNIFFIFIIIFFLFDITTLQCQTNVCNFNRNNFILTKNYNLNSIIQSYKSYNLFNNISFVNKLEEDLESLVFYITKMDKTWNILEEKQILIKDIHVLPVKEKDFSIFFDNDDMGKLKTDWEKIFDKSKYDYFSSIVNTEDGGYAIVGSVWENQEKKDNICLIKIDKRGNIQWENVFAGNTFWENYLGDNDRAYSSSIINAENGGLIISGNSIFGPYFYGFVKKFDKIGNIEWAWEKWPPPCNSHKINSIIHTNDNGYIITGIERENDWEVDLNAFTLKLNNKGDQIWEKTFGGSKDDSANSIIQDKDGSYVIAGTILNNSNNVDAYLIKIYENLKSFENKILPNILKAEISLSYGLVYSNKLYVLFKKNLEKIKNNDVRLINQSKDSSYIIAGWKIFQCRDEKETWIMKLNEISDIFWEKNFCKIKDFNPNSIIQTRDGGYAVSGTRELGEIKRLDGWVMKLNKNGNVEWNRTFGGEDNDELTSIIQTRDGGYAASGWIMRNDIGEKDGWLLVLDNKGKVVFEGRFRKIDWNLKDSIILDNDTNGFIILWIYEIKKRFQQFQRFH